MPTPQKTTVEDTPVYAHVALPLPTATAFTYEVPRELAPRIFVGCRVEVPLGRRFLKGFVVALTQRSDVARTKPIREVLETHLTGPLLDLVGWMASYYGCSFGEAAQAVIPPSFRRPSRRRRVGAAKTGAASPAAGGEGGGAPDAADPVPVPFSLDTVDAPVRELTPDQEAALASISRSIAAGRFSAFLLHGVTGSGKTEIYLRAARSVVSSGGGCIVLVPEISLLPLAVARYRKVFGTELAVIHSRLTGTERFDIWERVQQGACRIVLGPRSAIFSPVVNLKLVIVDEEQDDSYKQEDKPRYHARHVALMRGKREGLAVVLGSATPSAESFHLAAEGRYAYLSLPTRVGGASLPSIEYVDLRKEPMEAAFLSARLLERLESHVRNGHQCILFLNRRGHARFVQCNACGWVAKCRNCDIALTFHRVANRLRCHYCGYSRAAAAKCDECGSAKLFFAGAGTQRVELDLAALMPGVGTLRMDADTTTGKEGHRKILEQFGTGRYPVLIGTQMVAKGHHFPRVNLVGVLHAEESLNYPDFRSSERTFQQLMQVAGRAGRAGGQAEVIIQTFTPDHYVFRHLSAHDFGGFMREELDVRRQLRYPPFSRIVLASCSASSRETLHRVVERWAGEVRRRYAGPALEVLGPVPPPLERLKNRYREHVMIKGKLSSLQKDDILGLYRTIAEDERGGTAVELRWDVDPESFA